MAAQFRVSIQSLDAILRLRRGGSLPLHIAWSVGAAAFQGHHMIHHVPGASTGHLPRRRAWMAPLEGMFGRLAPGNATPGVP